MSDPNVAAAYAQSLYLGAEGKEIFAHTPFVPYDSTVDHYEWAAGGFPFLVPWEYTGWRNEQLSWKETAYLHAGLNPTPTYKISGPDALRFLRDHLVNSFEKFPVNSGKHGIMCNEDGFVMSDGVLIRTGEEEFITYWLAPYIAYALQKGDYDAVGEDITASVSLFQIAGPRSLDILEAATGENLRDIKFMRMRQATIAGVPVRVLRMGMGGSLAYEIHGDLEHSRDIYSAIWAAGEPLGCRKLGIRAYMMNHTENGFPQAYYHFVYPWTDDPGFVEFLSKLPVVTGKAQVQRGSYDPDPRSRYRTPVELGWTRMIKFDHDFVGRAALEREVADPKRTMVTLEWNPEDILDIHRSQYEPGEPHPGIEEPNRFTFTDGANTLFADQVLVDGEVVGISSGRCYSAHYRQMLSLCSLDIAHAVEGGEVAVLWGDPGTRQKEVRARVSRFPYLNEGRNQTIDVTKI
ncbi:aminomethyl transferase family protein [Streptomyces sp. NPDC057257]|uniref:aminomethyl transferase family protein n=1 Tax=Streptomyces sp. NPDC057257 TaxID=3346071 RepID=UPI00362DA316